MDKRIFIKSIALATAGIFVTGFTDALKAAKSKNKWDGIFKLPKLPYSFDALEPFIDSETMKLHYDQHAFFTEKLNIAVKESGLSGITPFELMKGISRYDSEIRNNCGGFVNHRYFWRIIAPSYNKKPSDQLTSAIVNEFGSFDKFKNDFTEEAKAVFGSGWVWLIIDNNGHLVITSSLNHDNPIMDISQKRGMPILCLDVWEHAYYIKNQNRKTDYINSFWMVVNWDVVSANYNHIIKNKISV